MASGESPLTSMVCGMAWLRWSLWTCISFRVTLRRRVRQNESAAIRKWGASARALSPKERHWRVPGLAGVPAGVGEAGLGRPEWTVLECGNGVSALRRASELFLQVLTPRRAGASKREVAAPRESGNCVPALQTRPR